MNLIKETNQYYVYKKQAHNLFKDNKSQLVLNLSSNKSRTPCKIRSINNTSKKNKSPFQNDWSKMLQQESHRSPLKANLKNQENGDKDLNSFFNFQEKNVNKIKDFSSHTKQNKENTRLFSKLIEKIGSENRNKEIKELPTSTLFSEAKKIIGTKQKISQRKKETFIYELSTNHMRNTSGLDFHFQTNPYNRKKIQSEFQYPNKPTKRPDIGKTIKNPQKSQKSQKMDLNKKKGQQKNLVLRKVVSLAMPQQNKDIQIRTGSDSYDTINLLLDKLKASEVELVQKDDYLVNRSINEFKPFNMDPTL